MGDKADMLQEVIGTLPNEIVFVTEDGEHITDPITLDDDMKSHLATRMINTGQNIQQVIRKCLKDALETS